MSEHQEMSSVELAAVLGRLLVVLDTQGYSEGADKMRTGDPEEQPWKAIRDARIVLARYRRE